MAHFEWVTRQLGHHQHRMPREPPGGYRWLTAKSLMLEDSGDVGLGRMHGLSERVAWDRTRRTFCGFMLGVPAVSCKWVWG
jgi:hypothetical protein